MTTPQTLRDLAGPGTTLEERIELAEQEVIRLARGDRPGGRTFRMTIPVERTDSDIVLIDGLKAGREALDRLESAERVRAAAREVVERAIDDNETLSIRLSNLIAALDHALSQPHSAESDTKFRAVGLEPRYIEAHPGLREAPTRDRRFQPHSAEGGPRE